MDVSKSINKLEIIDLDALKPKRTTEKDLFSDDKAKKQLAESIQTGHDIEFQASIEEHKQRVRELETGLYRAYGDLRSDRWMSKTMRDRLDGHADKDKLEDNVIDTLIAMRELMQAPQRSQYPHKTLTNALVDLLKCLMDRKAEESLIDWLAQHKQCRDVIKSLMGTRFLDGFVERLPEYQDLSTSEEKEKMKENAFEILSDIQFHPWLTPISTSFFAVFRIGHMFGTRILPRRLPRYYHNGELANLLTCLRHASRRQSYGPLRCFGTFLHL